MSAHHLGDLPMQATDDLIGGFILNEIRDLRKGMEGRDVAIRSEIASVRDAVGVVADAMTNSKNMSQALRNDLDSVMADTSSMKKDIAEIQKGVLESSIKSTSAWDGPKNILKVLVLLGGGAVAILSIQKLWPLIVWAVAI